MSLTLYYHPVSPPSNMVIAVLQHLNIEYEKKVIKLEEGEHKLEDYLKINPYGQVPTITDGDFCLNESIAIWRYLVQSKAESCDFYPFADAKKVAKINALLDHLLCAYIPGVTDFVSKTSVGVAFRGLPVPSADDVEQLTQGLKKSFDKIKFILDLSGGPYLTGENLTLADIAYYFCSIGALYLADGNLLDHPEIADWVQRVEETSTIAEVVKQYKETAAHYKEIIKKMISEKA